MDAAMFYTGIVVEAYAQLKSSNFDPEPYARFVASAGQPGLEIGCGDGNPLLALRRQGLDVEGADSSADMLERCRDNAAALGLDVTLHLQQMQSLALTRRYRSIYLAGPTFNLLPDDETARQALHRIRHHLTDDGAALIPLWIPEPTSPDDLGVTREATATDGALLRYTPLSETYDGKSRTRTTTTLYERLTSATTERVEREWILHWYSPEMFRSMCAEAGLRVTGLVDDHGEPATPAATDFTVTVQPLTGGPAAPAAA